MDESLYHALLVFPVGVLLTVLVSNMALLVARTLADRYRIRHERPLVERATQELAEGLCASDMDVVRCTRALAVLPRRTQTEILSRLSESLAGEALDSLRAVAEHLGLIPLAMKLWHSSKWWERLLALRVLGGLSHRQDVILDGLQDSHPLVRAEAAQAAALHPSPACLERLVECLDDPASLVLFSVQDTLIRLGRQAVEPVARRLEQPGTAHLPVLLTVAAGLADPRFLEAALARSRSEQSEVRALAATLLSTLGGQSANDRLRELLSDPEPMVRAAAAIGLGNLGEWSAAADLERMLDDAHFEVRYAAGSGLLALGPPGQLFLKRAATAELERPRRMARHLLALPGRPTTRGASAWLPWGPAA